MRASRCATPLAVPSSHSKYRAHFARIRVGFLIWAAAPVAVAGGSSLTGRVVDNAGLPVKHARVIVETLSGSGLAQLRPEALFGRFSAQVGIDEGTVHVRVIAEGYEEASHLVRSVDGRFEVGTVRLNPVVRSAAPPLVLEEAASGAHVVELVLRNPHAGDRYGPPDSAPPPEAKREPPRKTTPRGSGRRDRPSTQWACASPVRLRDAPANCAEPLSELPGARNHFADGSQHRRTVRACPLCDIDEARRLKAVAVKPAKDVLGNVVEDSELRVARAWPVR